MGNVADKTIDGLARREYQSREFCKSVRCGIQQQLERYGKGEPMYELTKNACRTGCTYPREEFLNWLIANDFMFSDMTKIDRLCESGTAYDFHIWLQEQGVRIVKKV